MSSFIHVPATYTFIPTPEPGATAVTVEQQSATVTESPAEETPADLDTVLKPLDTELEKRDELIGKAERLPAELAEIEKKHEALTSQELDTIEAIESRSAQMGKIAASREIATARQKRIKTDIAAQTEVVLKIGAQANGLAEQLWSSLHTKAYAEAKRELERLFFRAYEHPDVLSKFRPVARLESMKIPDLYTSSIDLKITRFRQLPERVARLRAFEKMTFEEISAELELQDRKSRERMISR
jgi:hypothetical protein